MTTRDVHQADAIAWMAANSSGFRVSVVTSLPDVSELALDLDGWRAWFIAAARAVIRWLPEDGVAIFYQSDVRHGGEWIDKGHLIARAIDDEHAFMIFHKIAHRKSPGTIARGRPSYSHMIAVSARRRETASLNPGPDIFEAGFQPWSKAMGVNACRVACKFLRDEIHATTIVDPFCGRGTVLAVANEMGMDAIGVDLSAKRCRRARVLVIEEAIAKAHANETARDDEDSD